MHNIIQLNNQVKESEFFFIFSPISVDKGGNPTNPIKIFMLKQNDKKIKLHIIKIAKYSMILYSIFQICIALCVPLVSTVFLVLKDRKRQQILYA